MKTKEELEELLKRLEFQFKFVNDSFENRLVQDFGLEYFPKALKNWFVMNYSEFKAELDVVLSRILVSTCTIQDWEEYFQIMKRNHEKLSKDISDTQNEINTLNN